MQIQVTVPDDTAELIEGLTNFIQSIKDSLEDGWQPGIDIPVILMKALSDLPSAIGGIDQMDDEAREDPAAMIVASGILAANIYKILVK